MRKSAKTIVAALLLCALFIVGTVIPAFAADKYVQVAGEPVVVRSGAGKSNPVIAKTHKGEEYEYLSEKKDAGGVVWYQIKLANGKTGYMTSQLSKIVEKTASVPSDKTVEIIGEPVVVRKDAGTSNTVIAKVHKGNKFACLGTKNDKNGKVWYKIEYASGKTGYVMGSLCKLISDSGSDSRSLKNYAGVYACGRATMTVKAVDSQNAEIIVEWGSSAWELTRWEMKGWFDSDTFRINYTEGVKSDVVFNDDGSLKTRSVLYTDGYGRVQFYDTNSLGWYDENEPDNGLMTFTKTGSSSYVPTPVPATDKTVEIIGEPVVVRKDAGTSNTVIAKVHKGNKFACLGTKNDNNGKVWYKIEYASGKTGFVMGSLCKLTDSAVVTTKKVEITGNPVNVRADAGLTAAKVGKTSKGKVFTYLDSKKDKDGKVWYKIQYTDKTTGWVLGSLAKIVEK